MRKTITVLAIIFSVILLCGCTDKVDNLIQEAQLEYDNGNYKKAKKLLESQGDDDRITELYEKISKALAMQDAQREYSKENYIEVLEILKNYEKDEESITLVENSQYAIYKNDVENIMKLKDSSEIVELITDFERYYEENTLGRCSDVEDKLIDTIDGYFSNEAEYDDFVKWEDVVKKLKKIKIGNSSSLAKSIERKLQSYGETKLRLILVGVWVRNDSTGMSGSMIKIIFNGNKGSASLIKAAKNDWGFVKGDIKWKNILILDDTSFIFDDLNRSYSLDYDFWTDSYNKVYSHKYVEASAVLDYDSLTINVHVTNDKDGDGNDQIWVKKENYSSETVTNKASENIKVDNEDSTYIFPNSDSKYLKKNQVKKLSSSELRLARNEIYARHGYIFESQDLQEYFSSKSWYYGSIERNDFDESELNKIEKANIKLIKKYE